MKAQNILFTLMVLGATISFLLLTTEMYTTVADPIKIERFESESGEKIEQTTSLLKTILLPILMILGIFAGELYHLFDKSKNDKINLKELSSIFSSRSLWKSLLSAPIIFAAVYSMSKGQTDIMIASLFAFENGFFCNIILSKRTQEVEGA